MRVWACGIKCEGPSIAELCKLGFITLELSSEIYETLCSVASRVAREI